MHNCPECGLAHDEPAGRGEDPMVKIAKVEAERDVEVAKIQAGVSREEMAREIDALRAELTVRREEPPVAESTVVEAVVEPEPQPELPPVEAAEPEPDPEPAAPPPDSEPSGSKERKRAGWWDAYA